MDSYSWEDNAKSKSDDFLASLCRNNSHLDETTNARSWEENTATSPMPNEYTVAKDMLAILTIQRVYPLLSSLKLQLAVLL